MNISINNEQKSVILNFFTVRLTWNFTFCFRIYGDGPEI